MSTEHPESIGIARGLLAVLALWLITIGLVQTFRTDVALVPTLFVAAGGWLLVSVRTRNAA